MTQDKEDYVDVKTLAQHLHVGKSFIYKLKNGRKIPYYKIGTSFRFKLSEVEEKVQTEMKYA